MTKLETCAKYELVACNWWYISYISGFGTAPVKDFLRILSTDAINPL
jgi:hypothetical protein